MTLALTAHSAIQTIRVLLVDDSHTVMAAIGLLLHKQPALLVVAGANNGTDTLAQVLRHEPDLVVMDVHMPGMNGLEAVAVVRRHRPQVRIIMISVDQDAGVQAECLRLGADRFLPKIGLQRRLLQEIAGLFPHLNLAANAAPGRNRTSDRATRHPDEDQSSWESPSHES
jgi:DNA-binding NarL/FixJ family response regulator